MWDERIRDSRIREAWQYPIGWKGWRNPRALHLPELWPRLRRERRALGARLQDEVQGLRPGDRGPPCRPRLRKTGRDHRRPAASRREPRSAWSSCAPPTTGRAASGRAAATGRTAATGPRSGGAPPATPRSGCSGVRPVCSFETSPPAAALASEAPAPRRREAARRSSRAGDGQGTGSSSAPPVAPDAGPGLARDVARSGGGVLPRAREDARPAGFRAAKDRGRGRHTPRRAAASASRGLAPGRRGRPFECGNDASARTTRPGSPNHECEAPGCGTFRVRSSVLVDTQPSTSACA